MIQYVSYLTIQYLYLTDIISYKKISNDTSSIFETNMNNTTVKNSKNNDIISDNLKKSNTNQANNSFFLLGNNLISNFVA